MNSAQSNPFQFPTDLIGDLDAVGMLALLRAGGATPTDLIEAAITRSEIVDRTCNTFALKTFDFARQSALNGLAGLLAGIPFAFKDTDDQAGFSTRSGSRALPQQAPSKKNSAYLKQLLSLGLISIGKTTTPEFGLMITTEPKANGPTRNPWDLGRTTGGSSGGACALVAAGALPMAHANDGAGSIRIPASCCGLVGLKPTRLRTARVDGSEVMPINILTQGMVSRTVRDTALFYSALEQVSPSSKLPRIGHVTEPGKNRLRIGLFNGQAWDVEDECAEAAERTAELCQRLGHQVQRIDLPSPLPILKDFFIYWGAMAFSIKYLGRVTVGKPVEKALLEPITHDFSSLFARNATRFPAVVARLFRAAREYNELLSRYDVLLTPTLGMTPPPLGYFSDASFEIVYDKICRFTPFTIFANLSGTPALQLPLHQSRSGLPVGIQLSAPFAQEARLLEIGLELERAQSNERFRRLGA